MYMNMRREGNQLIGFVIRVLVPIIGPDGTDKVNIELVAFDPDGGVRIREQSIPYGYLTSSLLKKVNKKQIISKMMEFF